MLTATQVKYAQGRVQNIYREKLDELDKKFRDTSAHSQEQKLDLVQEGKFEVVDRPHYRWYECIVFPKIEGGMTQKEYDKAKSDLKKTKDEITDGLILGDADEALNALKKLQEFEI